MASRLKPFLEPCLKLPGTFADASLWNIHSPLDYAVYYCHKDASEFLRGLQDGKPTRWEERRLVSMAVRMQAAHRGKSGRRAFATFLTAKKEKRELTEEEKKAVGAHF